jgi:hypothetical protein
LDVYNIKTRNETATIFKTRESVVTSGGDNTTLDLVILTYREERQRKIMEGRLEQLLARCGEHNITKPEPMAMNKLDRRHQNEVYVEYTLLCFEIILVCVLPSNTQTIIKFISAC